MGNGFICLSGLWFCGKATIKHNDAFKKKKKLSPLVGNIMTALFYV